MQSSNCEHFSLSMSISILHYFKVKKVPPSPRELSIRWLWSLFGRETWTLKAPDVRRLSSFHNHCVRTILGVTGFQQWQNRITSWRLSGQFGLYWSIANFILKQRLKWPGHLGRMNSERLPQATFVWRTYAIPWL